MEQLEEFIDDPLNIIGDMSYDEYSDWLDLGSRKDLEETLIKLQESGVAKDYIEVLKLKLKK